MNNKLERKYGLFTAICMVVGIVIGSGVFFKAQTILQITNGDMPLGVIAWLIGGAIMLACILTFAGMSQKYEKVNGIVDYAEATVGPKYGYYMGWFLSTIYYPSLTAALAWLSARYTLVFLTTMFPNMPLLIPINLMEVAIRPLALCMRLFGNILGAFIIMEMLKLLVPVVLPAVFSLYFDLFDGLIQTVVFVFLTTLFTGEGIKEED